MTFTWPIRVYYEDTDAGGVVYYANYLKFFERARTEMLRSMGYQLDRLADTAGIVFLVRSVRLDYLRPARFNQLLTVTATIDGHTKTSLTFAQTISHADTVLCTGSIRVACVDADSLRPRAIPDFLLEQLSP